jgi:hypothetical protein
MTTTHLRYVLPGALLAALVAVTGLAGADEAEGQDAQAAFFAGLDLKEVGDCEGAIARFQLALGRDPEMVQARLHMADCYHTLGLDEEAVTELIAYLSHPFPGIEQERAEGLLVACGGDPGVVVVVPPADIPEEPAEGDPGEGSEGGIETPTSSAAWTAARLEVGARAQRYANRIGLFAVGPVVGVRILPVRFVEIGVDGAFGLGGYSEHDGIVQVPTVSFSAGASIPVKRVRILAGVVIPLLISSLDGAHRVDPGVLGEVGVRVLLGDGRLVLGGHFGGGVAVSPTVGGGVSLGIQLGPLGGAR